MCSKHAGCKQGCITAAGDVQCAVWIFFADGEQLAENAVRFEQADFCKDQLRIPAAAPKEGFEFCLAVMILYDVTGAQIDNAAGTEHIRCQNVFNGTLVVQFN